MKIINEYTTERQFKNFPDLENKIKEYYDFIIDTLEPYPGITARGYMEYRVTFRDIFYYISWLYDNDPKSVLDWGCGDNIFKRWFPNMIGADLRHYTCFNNKPDLFVSNIDEFYRDNKEKFDCGMALNSIHFCDYNTFQKNLLNCMNFITTGGRFLFLINYSALFKNNVHTLGKSPLNLNMYDERIYNFIESTGYKIVLFDPIISRGFEPGSRIKEGYADLTSVTGAHVRFILEK